MIISVKFAETNRELGTKFAENTQEVEANFAESTLKADANFEETVKRIDANFEETAQNVDAKFGDVQTVTKYVGSEIYTGKYSVTPKVTEQILPTQDKVMVNDLTVKAIPFFNVSNPSGGNTVYIGSEV